MSWEEPGIVLFSSIPTLDNFLCVTVALDPQDQRDSSAKSDYHWQILKCRILIFQNSDILASPVLGSLSYIHMVVQKSYYKLGRLDSLIEKNNLKSFTLSEVSRGTFEACLRYTLLAKIAPEWNLVEKYLVNGRDFLLCPGPLKCIKLEILAKEGEVTFSLKVYKMHLPKIILEVYINNKDSLLHIESGNFFMDLSNDSHWIYVLPSMKKGRVVEISNKLSQFSTFKDYKELKRHWKNTYGYRLPESEDGMLYFGINFFGRNVFTYPVQCVRSCPPHLINMKDKEEVIIDFLENVNQRLNSVCGVPLRLDYKIAFPYPILNNCAKIEEYENVNLRDWSGRKFKTLDDLIEETHYSNSSQMYTQPLSLSTQYIEQQSQNRPPPMVPKFASLKINPLFNMKPKTDDIKNNSEVNDKPLQLYKPNFSKPQAGTKTMFSVMKENPKIHQEQVNQIASVDSNPIKKMAPIKPTFKSTFPKKINPSFPVKENKPLPQERQVSNASKNEPDLPLVRPVFKPLFNKKPQPTPTKVGKIKKEITKTKVNTNKKISQASVAAQLNIGLTSEVLQIGKNIQEQNVGASQNQPDLPLVKPSFKPLFNKKVEQTLKNEMMNKKANTSKKTTLPGASLQTISLMGEVLQLGNKPETAKKPRGSVKEVDVEGLARSGKLQKANAPTLIDFLKKNGVSCKTRDKKQDLVNKVLSHFNLPTSS